VHLAGVADGDGGQSLGVDLQDRHVGRAVEAHHLGCELTLVGELDRDQLGILDDMRVGEDQSVRFHDETRPEADRRPFLLIRPEAAREIPGHTGDHRPVIGRRLRRALHPDIDHGGPEPVDNRREVRSRHGRRWSRRTCLLVPPAGGKRSR
jgi:hypothetical protein